MTKLTKEQEQLLADLAVKTAKQEGVQKVRRWTDVGDSPGRDYHEDHSDGIRGHEGGYSDEQPF
jgi:hypothetical protein